MTLTSDRIVAEAPARLPRIGEQATAALFSAARTANSFDGSPVSDEELREIWELAKWPPTAANLQPLRVVFVRTPAGRDRLVPAMNEGNQAKTESAPAVAVLAYDTRMHEHVLTVLPFRPGLRDALEADEAARLSMAERNAWLQAGYLILAIRATGLAAGPMAGFDADAVDREFFPDGRFRSFLVVNIGHPGPAAWLDRLPRLSEEQVVGWA